MNDNLTLTDTNQLAITEAQFAILTQATQADEVRHRRGKGGRQFAYTDPAYVIRTLNLAFGWDWDFEADNEETFYANSKPFEVKVRGRLTVRNGGNVITKVQFGCQPIEYLQNSDTPVSLGDAYKGAASDALKKCASLLGVALDLYDSDSDINTGKQPQQVKHVRVEADPTPQPATVTSASQSPLGKPANGGDKKIDPMTRYWQEVKAAGIDRQQGLKILADANNDPSRAVDVLNGMAQA